MKLPIPEQEAVRAALAVLTPRDRRLYFLAVFLRLLLSLLDLLGVLLLGAVGFLLASASGTGPVPPQIETILDLLGLSSVPNTTAALALGGVAAVLLIIKSVVALFIQTRLLRFLGNRAGVTGDVLSQRFLRLPLLEVRRYPSQTTAYALIEGVNGLIIGILNNLMVFLGEVVLLVLLALALLVVDPLTTVAAVVYFGAIAWILNRRLGVRARTEGREMTESSIAARTVTQDAVDTYPEITVMNRRELFADQFGVERRRYAESQAKYLIYQSVPRYGMEAAMVLGAVIMAGTLALTKDLAGAVGGIVLFLAAASRVVPALLRLNAAVIGMRNQAVAAEKAAELADQINAAQQLDVPRSSGSVASAAPKHQTDGQAAPGASLDILEVSLAYPDRDDKALVDINLSVPAGQSLALAGTSGAGKSSLVAVLLGLIEPTNGAVFIAGRPPRDLIEEVPGSLGYVPQDVALVSGTIRDNVALGLHRDHIDDAAVWAALERAHLSDLVVELPQQLDTLVGERGVRLSGGQRQRLGLARALYSPPQLLVLDEATSALDAETENVVSDTIASLGGQVTTVTVAHRLATIRNADIVAYLDGGRLVAQGSFEEVRAAVPGFERQAQLLGL